jgi:hypothetical protein
MQISFSRFNDINPFFVFEEWHGREIKEAAEIGTAFEPHFVCEIVVETYDDDPQRIQSFLVSPVQFWNIAGFKYRLFITKHRTDGFLLRFRKAETDPRPYFRINPEQEKRKAGKMHKVTAKGISAQIQDGTARILEIERAYQEAAEAVERLKAEFLELPGNKLWDNEEKRGMAENNGMRFEVWHEGGLHFGKKLQMPLYANDWDLYRAYSPIQPVLSLKS